MVSLFTRYRQIGEVLLKYGFGMILEKLFPGIAPWRMVRRGAGVDTRPVSVRIRLAIEELGPTFIKLGQIMSTRRELLPPSLIDELNRLTDDVAPVPFETIRPVIEEYCGPITEAFRSIDRTPVAAASLSQVHRAVLGDGREVALKVQRPGIDEVIETDLQILKSLARRIEERYPETIVYNPSGIVEEFGHQIRRELDFVRDGKNAEYLAFNLRNNPHITIPKIHWEYSGTRLLTMDYIRGVRIDDVAGIRAMGFQPEQISGYVFESYLQQIFEDGFFHGDPHPGNLLVTPTGQVAFLDFGIIGVLRPERREIFIKLLFGLVDADVELVMDCYRKLGIPIRDEDLEAFKDETYYILQEYQSFEIRQFDFRQIMVQIPDVLRRYHLQVPLSLMQMIKVIMMNIDIGRLLDPGFNFASRVEPYLSRILRKHLFSEDSLRRISHSVIRTTEDMIELPHSLNRSLKRISDGTLTLEIVSPDIEFVGIAIDKAISKIVIGLVCAAIVLGSSVVILAADVPMGQGICTIISLLTLAGYLVAVFVAIAAIYHIMKRPRKK
jgi:ubiquinone biosynthesis protein